MFTTASKTLSKIQTKHYLQLRILGLNKTIVLFQLVVLFFKNQNIKVELFLIILDVPGQMFDQVDVRVMIRVMNLINLFFRKCLVDHIKMIKKLRLLSISGIGFFSKRNILFSI